MGLGVGILLTTLILSFSDHKEKPSREEIIEMATELGMVLPEKQNAKDVWGSITPKPTEEVEADTSTPDETKSPDETSTLDETTTPSDTTSPDDTTTPDATTTPKPSPSLEPTPTPEATPKPTATPTPVINNQETGNDSEDENQAVNQGENISFTIEKGMSSGKVARLLEEIGLIDDADRFNEYIISAKKANDIQIGNYTVTVGASYEEILRLITE